MSGGHPAGLRDAVFGVQDGLVSTLGALTGIGAGTGRGDVAALSGLVIVAVESLSMAAGSYLSSKAQREFLEAKLREEHESIVRDPEGERREIWEMYRARGYGDDEIAVVEKRLMSDPALLLEDMAHKELAICPRSLETPLTNALVMGVAYLVGGAVPVAPYLVLPLGAALPVSIAATVAALFAFGGLKGRVVGRSWWRSGLEMTLIAGLAAAVGFAIGRLADFWLR